MENLDFLTPEENEARNKFLEKFSPEKIYEITSDKISKKLYGTKNDDSLIYNVEVTMGEHFGTVAGHKTATTPIFLNDDNIWQRKKKIIDADFAQTFSIKTKESIQHINSLIKGNNFVDLFSYLNENKEVFCKLLMHKYLCVIYPKLFLYWHTQERFNEYKKILNINDDKNIFVVEKYFWDKYKDNIENLNMKEETKKLEQQLIEKNQGDNMDDTSYLVSIIKALKNLGGQAPLSKIYSEVRYIRQQENKTITASHEANIRGVIEAHSSDSKKFAGKEKDNIFKKIKKGVWALREGNFENVDIVNDNINENNTNNKISNQPLNQILYGPPGTGKTYNTVIKAMEIIDPTDDYKNIDYNKYKELKNKFDEFKKSGQIEFITFHQSYSYEEFIEGIKPDVKNTDKIVYKIEDGIFKKIADEALFNSLNITKQQEQNEKEFDEVLNIFKINHQEGTELSTVFSQTKFIILEYLKDSIRIKPKVGNTIYSISYEPLQEIYEKDKKNNISNATELGERMDGRFAGISSYYFAFLYYLKQYSKQINTTNQKTINFDKAKFLREYYNGNIKLKENPNKYILIIDEINRGNISKIFGEMITLIEEDKRIGTEHELKLTLPYSKKPFGIPNNLYIIGTMNTSDRSIASIDIALRRRFKFVEMMPKEELVADITIGDSKNFKDIFKALNEKITILLDRDHQIGHSYFIEDKFKTEDGKELDNDIKIEMLKNIWFDEILPLLNEYFYNDWDKLQALLGKASKNNDSFITIKETELPFYQYDIEDKVYDFVDKGKISDNFELALLKIIDEPKNKQEESSTNEQQN